MRAACARGENTAAGRALLRELGGEVLGLTFA
jgi:hypothetical protein